MSRALLIFIIMLVAGAASSGVPVGGDEALFLLDAERLHDGAVLYRDVWDVTNPGLFWYYQAAGTLFGFHDDGLRLFDFLYWLLFVFTLSYAIRRHYELPRLPLAPALLAGGLYFFNSYTMPSHLAKAEGVVAFPLFLAIWLAAKGERRRMLFLAGVAGGAVLLIKLMFGILLIVGWSTLLILHIRRDGLRSALLKLPWIFLGLSVPLLLATLYFATNDALVVAVQTLFVLPPKFLAEGTPAPLSRLMQSAAWFVRGYSPVLALAFLGCARGRRDPFVLALCAAFLACFGVLVAQRLSWWSYHFVLPGAVAGVLAAWTWPALVQTARDRLKQPLSRGERLLLSLAAVILFLPAIAGGAATYRQLAAHRFGLTRTDRIACREADSPAYRHAAATAAFVTRPGGLLVCGDPLIYRYAGRLPATRINGWSLELYPQEVRNAFIDDVRNCQPTFVYVDRVRFGFDMLIREKYPELAAILATDYTATADDRGVWYVRCPRPR